MTSVSVRRFHYEKVLLGLGLAALIVSGLVLAAQKAREAEELEQYRTERIKRPSFRYTNINWAVYQQALAQGYCSVRGVEPSRAAVSQAAPEVRDSILCDLMRPGLFAPGEFDLVVFNASLHFSSDAARTLAAAMEVLDRRGILYILDSPFYTRVKGGEQMIQEWNRGFMRRFNRQVSELGPKGYLTLEMLKELNTRYRVECIRPAYGIRWALRPYIARFLRRREPATFRIAAIYKE